MGSSATRRNRRRADRASKRPPAKNLPVLALPFRGSVDVVVSIQVEVSRLGPCLEALRAELPASATITVADSVRETLPDAGKRHEEIALVSRRFEAHVIRNARGQWDARNRAASAGQAPLLFFLDGDAVLAHGAWAKVSDHMGREDVGVLGGMLLWGLNLTKPEIKEGTIKYAGFAFGARLMPYARFQGWLPDNSKIYARDDLQAVPAAIMVTRRTLFRNLHGFDPADNFKGLCYADAHYCVRARANGLLVAFEPTLFAVTAREPFAVDGQELRAGGQVLQAISRHLCQFDEYRLL